MCSIKLTRAMLLLKGPLPIIEVEGLQGDHPSQPQKIISVMPILGGGESPFPQRLPQKTGKDGIHTQACNLKD